MAGRFGKRVYSTAPWRRLRLAARAAAGGRCQTCGAWCWADGECHHVNHLARGGALIPQLAGVVWTCKTCHFAEHRRRPERAEWDELIAGLS